MTLWRYQTDANRAGEIEHRRLLAKAPVETWMPMVEKRMEDTKRIFRKLNLPINHLWDVAEIGADKCQRIMALVEEYGMKGYAIDISPDMLRLGAAIAQHRNWPDGRRLKMQPIDLMEYEPDVPFHLVICFATVHHFPDPRPVFAKVKKMLGPKGYFYFDREPMKSYLGLHEVKRIWGGIKYGREPETKYGILEDSFPLEEWIKAFDLFEDWDVSLSWPHTPYRLDMRKVKESRWLRSLARTTGGRLSGLLRKF